MQMKLFVTNLKGFIRKNSRPERGSPRQKKINWTPRTLPKYIFRVLLTVQMVGKIKKFKSAVTFLGDILKGTKLISLFVILPCRHFVFLFSLFNMRYLLKLNATGSHISRN